MRAWCRPGWLHAPSCQPLTAPIRQVAALEPLLGYNQSVLPGAIKGQRERAWATEGVPVGREHQARLTAVAAELGVAMPW